MRSLGRTTRGAADSVKETVGEYKGWLILAAFGYGLYKFNGVFSTLSDTAKAGLDAATAEMKAKAEASAAASKVKSDAAINQAKVSAIAPGASSADVAQYRADAETIAAALGTQKGVFTRQWLFADGQTAFNIIKQKYSRLMLSNNKPWDATKKVSQSAETSTSAKRKINHAVLQPFYSEITGGRNLVADVKDSCSASKYQPVLKWIL